MTRGSSLGYLRAPMGPSTRQLFAASLAALLGVGVTLSVQRLVRADGVPTMNPLIYRGFIEDNARPVEGTRSVRVSLWSELNAGMERCATSASVTVTAGRFELPLDEACTTAVQANPNLWVELRVGSDTLTPRTKLGAVPYAIESTRAQRAAGAEGALLSRIQELEQQASTDCPAGWTVVTTEAGFEPANNLRRLCRKTLPDGSVDELVRVGVPPTVFWIDRYEASVIRAGAPYARVFEGDMTYPELLRNGQWRLETGVPTALRAPFIARSVSAVRPARWVTWFQATELCQMVGKRLPTSEEWLTAAQGTEDPGDNNGAMNARCNTGNGMGGASPAAPRNTGEGSGCRSAWGAQDMIGNVWEMTGTLQAGVGAGGGSTPTGTMPGDGWPTDGNLYAGDGTWNLSSSAHALPAEGPRVGIPSAMSHGGSFLSLSRAGRFALDLNDAPTSWNSNVGFRCVVRR